ncbi:MAG: glycoside hydrolase family 18 protein [Candidatus Aminicenantales bacterium]
MSRRRTLLLLLVILLAGMCSRRSTAPENLEPESQALTKIVMGYYPAWKKGAYDYSRLRYEHLTHIAHAFTKPDADGHLIVDDDYIYPELVDAAHRNDVKAIMSIGGWGNCEGFPGMAASVETRARFISQVLAFLKANHYDGVDIDWEFVSNPAEQLNFVLFIKELSAALKTESPPLELTMAAPSGHYWGKWISYEEVVGCFDFIAVMTYDYHGEWSDHSGHNSPLYSCAGDTCGSWHDSFLYHISRGIPREKLLLGLAFFGRSFDCPEFYQPFRRSLQYGYDEIVELRDSGWVFFWDDCAHVPFLRKPDKSVVLSYDNEQSVALKCRYVKENGAAGVIIWELTQDDSRGEPALLKRVGETFRTGQSTP